MLSSDDDSRVAPYLREALAIANSIGNNHLKEECFRLDANYNLKYSKFKEAKEAAFKALAFTDTTNKSNLRYLYDLLATASIQTNDKDNALLYFNKYVIVTKESVSEEWVSKISEMEVKYETEKKALKIESLESQNRIQTHLNYALGLVFVLMITSALFIMRSIRNERKMAQQKIIQLEKKSNL